jgi:chromosome partitioning protein
MVISLIAQKGGSSRTTIATNLAVEFVQRGRRVLLVDADPQMTASTWASVGAEAGHRMPSVVAMGATMHKPGQLDELAQGYDIVIVDGPPRHGEIQKSALMVADIALLPCSPSPGDVWALGASVELVREAMTYRKTLRPKIVITRKRSQTALGKQVRDALSETGFPIMGAELGFRQAYQEALGSGMGVTTFSPKDPAAAEIRELAGELLALAEEVAHAA